MLKLNLELLWSQKRLMSSPSLWEWNQIQVNALSLWMTRSSLLPMGGRGSLIVCGWGYCPWGQETTCRRGPIWRALSVAYGGWEKPWRYGWDCCLWGQESTYHRGQFHASCEWVDPLTGLCGSVVYLW